MDSAIGVFWQLSDNLKPLGFTHFCREQLIDGAPTVVARFIGRGEACGAATNRRTTRLWVFNSVSLVENRIFTE